VLLYLSPALMDWMVFFVSFAVFYAAGVRGVGMAECGWLGILFQGAYMTSSFVSGHFITHGNARKVLWMSTLVCGISSAGILCSNVFGLLAAGLLVFGGSAAWFFNSFQAFMRGAASVGSLKSSVALYSLSWCLGAALGNVTAGWLYLWGVPALTLAVVFATGAILFLLARKHTDIGPTVDEPVELGSRQKYPVANHYILIGWLMIFTATFVQRPLFTFLPPLFAKEGISSLWASLPLFMHMAVSAFFGLAMFRFRDFLYRRTPFFIIQGGGVVALCAMWIWPSYWVCFSMLCLLGIYAGFVYYCAVYYASNSGRRSFNTGVNEALVGFGSIAGIVLGDIWMRHSGSPADVYLVCGAGLAASLAAQMTIVFLKRKPGVLLPVSPRGSSE
jgi:Major Facilitator Superfamily